jgi:bacterioferritin-associated ferredoxin
MSITIGTQHEHPSSSWPDDDRQRWIASTDPERPAEITAPIPIAQCASCVADNRHTWSEVEAERIGGVTLRRNMCVCHQCGRCDARLVLVDPNPEVNDHV